MRAVSSADADGRCRVVSVVSTPIAAISLARPSESRTPPEAGRWRGAAEGRALQWSQDSGQVKRRPHPPAPSPAGRGGARSNPKDFTPPTGLLRPLSPRALVSTQLFLRRR